MVFAPHAPRCRAKSKRTGLPCQAPAEHGKKVCRFHGARAGAPRGKAHGRYKHGFYSIESIEQRKRFREIMKQFRAFAKGEAGGD